jgi:hypothetical protein
MARPIPRLAPVTTATLSLRTGLDIVIFTRPYMILNTPKEGTPKES